MGASLYPPKPVVSASFNWRGDFLPGATYKVNDAVRTAAGAWICTVAHVAGATLVASNWSLMVSATPAPAPTSTGGADAAYSIMGVF